MVCLGVAFGLVPVRSLLDLNHNFKRIDMLHISHEESASSQGYHRRSLRDGRGGPVARWNALHACLNDRRWAEAREWIGHMASRPDMFHEVAGLVVAAISQLRPTVAIRFR